MNIINLTDFSTINMGYIYFGCFAFSESQSKQQTQLFLLNLDTFLSKTTSSARSAVAALANVLKSLNSSASESCCLAIFLACEGNPLQRDAYFPNE